MKQTTLFCRLGVLGVSTACLLLGASGHSAQAAPAKAPAKMTAPVEALIYSTMPATAAHRPEMALDGDPATYFKSAYGMSDGDDFLVLLSRPIPARSLHITTGDADGQDQLTNGFVETSPDGVHFRRAAAFSSAGVADATLPDTPVEAVRIRLSQGQNIPFLLVREIEIASPEKISHVQWGPGRGFIDLSQAPDLAAWAQTAERQMEESWPDTEALLYTDKFIPPNAVNVVYRTGPGVTDVAATGGGVMTVNSAWCRQHPEDTGLTVHETAHVIQAYSAYDPVWMVEGIADYIRWVRFQPEDFQYKIVPGKSTYHDSYRTTAAFLGWCELHYDSRLVTKLSEAVRFGTYKNSLFQTYCGKDVDTLWSEFLAAYQADPKTVLAHPIAAADLPRPLPAVAAGSSVPVDLSSVFNRTGITRDGAVFPATGGADAGGAAFSAALLGSALTWKDLQFQIGPAGAPDIVSCQGNVISLPAGRHSSVWLLATGVDGSPMNQVFTVTYADGTTQDLTQNFSDWFEPHRFPGESRAVQMAYRNLADGTKDSHTFSLYTYGFALDSAKTVKSITLPTNENVELFALTLAD